MPNWPNRPKIAYCLLFTGKWGPLQGVRVLNVGTQHQLVPGVGGSILPETVSFWVLTVLTKPKIATIFDQKWREAPTLGHIFAKF